MGCFWHGFLVGFFMYLVGRYLGRQHGLQEMADYLYQRHPQISYWEKIRRGQEN